MRHFIIARLLAAILAALTVSDATCEAALTLGFETTSHKAAYDGPLPWPSAALIDAPHRFIGSADPLRSLAHVEETTLGGKTTDYVSGAGMTIARLIDGVPTYVHSDHLGSPREFSTSAGGLAGWAHYSPFGVDYHSNLPGDQAGFTGHIKDSDTGLSYMQARYYDPVIGRFLSIDPMDFMSSGGNPGYFNRYAYSLNDPINRIDPDGEASFLVSRPLNGPPGKVANHMFVVVVDPQTRETTRFSYGPQGNPLTNPGKLVSHPTTDTSTGKDDDIAMKAFLKNSSDAAGEGIVGVQLDIPDADVLASGEAMNNLLGTVDNPGENAPNYAPLTSNGGDRSISNHGLSNIKPPTANSNSAAIGVPNRASPGHSQSVPPGTNNPGVNQERNIPDY